MKTSEEKGDVDIRGRKGSSQKTSILIFALLLLVTATLSVTFIVLYAIRDRSSFEDLLSSDVCQSDACFELSVRIKGSMNEDVDPCEDFINFTCGNWAIYNGISEGTRVVMCQNLCIYSVYTSGEFRGTSLNHSQPLRICLVYSTRM